MIGAEKSKRANALADIRGSAAAPVPGVVTPPAAPAAAEEDPEAPLEERAKATWDSDKELRTEFGTFEAYHGYRRASEKGLIKVLKK
ncbi:hypothetical protein D3C81_2123040 [compost metagenome]